MTSSSGAEIARFPLRTTIGVAMLAHGLQNGRSLPGTAAWFRSIGFLRPEPQANPSAAVEQEAGTAVLAGAATPVAAFWTRPTAEPPQAAYPGPAVAEPLPAP